MHHAVTFFCPVGRDNARLGKGTADFGPEHEVCSTVWMGSIPEGLTVHGPPAGTRGRRNQVLQRVLVVEDEQDVAELVEDVLEMEGLEVMLAVGETALDHAIAFEPDVVLLDLMMPGVDGFEVARRLRAHEATQDIPIVVMTAMHDPESRAADVGTNYFLAKPFDINVLLATVQRAAAIPNCRS